MADSSPGTTPGPSPSPTVAPNGTAGQPAVAPAAPGAKESAPLFGGLRGGRARADGLVPGSPEAVEADRKKDRLRKKADRKQKQDPPPLPSANGTPHTTQAAPGGVVPVPGSEAAPVIPWTAEDLKPIFDQLVPALEELSKTQITERAFKAKLPQDVLQEVCASAEWPELAKKGVQYSGPHVGAKWLTQFGIPAENKYEVVLVTAAASIAANHFKVLRRLDKLIALSAAQKKEDPKP
jgi:hypothetical protein